MTEYNFFQDLFDTYQSMSVFMQLAWLVVPFVFAAVFFALILHHMRKMHGMVKAPPCEEYQIYKMMNEDLEERFLASERDELRNIKELE